MLGTWELLLIGLVVLVLFGGAQLPKLAKSLGNFVNDFNTAKATGTPKKKAKAKTKKKKA